MAARIKKLQDRAAALTAAMRALNDKAADEERQFSDPEQTQYDAHKDELAEVKADLAREEELQAVERELAAVPDGNEATEHEATELNGQRGERVPETFPSFGHMLQAVARSEGVARADWDQRLIPQAAISGLNETTGSQGGFLVGTDTVSSLLTRTYENSAILNGGAGYAGVRKLPISAGANSIKINAVNESSRATGSRWGGVQAYWLEEAGEKTSSKPNFRQMELSLKKLIGLCYATDELLQDAAALEAVIMEAFAEEFAFMIQDALVNGTGAGQPQGILPATCLVSVAKETGQAAATVVKENIDKMYSRMWAKGIPTSVWHINQNVYPQLFGLTQSVGTGGMPVYLPPGGLSASPYGTLMGRPVVPIEQCQTLGTKGDIYFCDWSQYLFSEKGGIDVASSIHVRFIYDESVFRFVFRCDGQPAWNTALTPFKGGAGSTVGPFVALAVRA
jgi:HK97 family phage major capsid protein